MSVPAKASAVVASSTLPAALVDAAVTVAVVLPLESVPTEVNEEAVTLDFSVLPLKVPAAAVTVMFADPLKATPLMFLDVVNVAADPVVF